MKRLLIAALALSYGAAAHADPGTVRSITIRAPRDIGYFVGDLVAADIDLVVARPARLDPASLPHPGPINYWLDLRRIDVSVRDDGPDRHYTLKLLYQDFYDALDARPMEIPTFPVQLRLDGNNVTADIPAWTIGVSSLREVAPPLKADPKEYLRDDEPAPIIDTAASWNTAIALAAAALLTLVLPARDRAWWPFHTRPARIFGAAVRRLHALARQPDAQAAYLEALRTLHRGLDRTDGRRVLGDDLPAFLRRNPVFAPQQPVLAHFFAASRQAFFAGDPARSQQSLPFASLQACARAMAAAERSRP